MTADRDSSSSRRGSADDTQEFYSYNVLLYREVPDAADEPYHVDQVKAPSMLEAYQNAMEDLRKRADDPDDPLHGSRFRYPRKLARRLGEASEPAAPPPAAAPSPVPAAGPPTPAVRARPAVAIPRPSQPGARHGEGPYEYDVRVRATDVEGVRHRLLWRWRATSLLTAYRTVLEGLAAAPEWRSWSFEAEPIGVRTKLAQTRGTDGRNPHPVPEPDEVHEDRSAGPPPREMSDEELASLDETWR